MGTSNLTMVISNGKTKVAQYGQWDGYPEGQGKTALETLKQIIHLGQLGQFKTKIDNLKWVSKKDAKKVEDDENWTTNYPYLSRDCGAQILYAIHFGKMVISENYGEKKEVKIKIIGLGNQEEFASDSLMCEWAYVIDLDKATFEVYKGFNKEPLTESDRFYHLQDLKEGYAPVKLFKSYPIDNLPTMEEFLSIDKEEEVED